MTSELQWVCELTTSAFTPEGVAAIPVLVDLMSLGLLKGA